MATDYDQILRDNLTEYGHGTRHLAFLGRLYADRTHFIYELLQNAEDAGATAVQFELYPDRLDVRHDGRPFNEADVRGICGVAESTKEDDLTKIGKFGIGFKSVYAYTRTPQIHSGDEHFEITDYVRPRTAPSVDHRVSGGQTAFSIPFDHPEVPADIAAVEIGKALNDLPLQTLLFLRRIGKIEVQGDDVTAYVLTRSVEGHDGLARVVRLEELGDEPIRERWLVWERSLEAIGFPHQRVELACRVEERDGRVVVRPVDESPLVVFFPTEKETNLGFLVQGPYRTTPARDNIPHDDDWNQRLVAETAELLISVLLDLRDRGRLTVDILSAMPVRPERFAVGTMFRPLFEVLKARLRDEPLLPAEKGGYLPADRAKLGRGARLRTLFTADDLALLWKQPEPLGWLAESLSADRTPALYRYLREELGVEEVTPESILLRLTAAFLEAKSDDWLSDFYSLIEANTALWRPPRHQWDSPGPVRRMPIIRLEDGRQVAPFDHQGHELVWLPGPVASDFPTVRRSIAERPDVARFLVSLGLTPPDLADEVLSRIIPRYERGEPVSDEHYEQDLDVIEAAFADATAKDKERMVDRLRKAAFCPALHGVSGKFAHRPATEVNEPGNELKLYLDGNPSAWFFDQRYEARLPVFRTLGVRDAVTITKKPANSQGHVVIVSTHGWHRRGLDGFDPNATIDGLDHALSDPNLERSMFVWNQLLSARLVRGMVAEATRQDYSNATQQEHLSAVGKLATEAAWLPGPDGGWRRPHELHPGDLPDGFRHDEELARALGMVVPEVEIASRQLGIPPEVLRYYQDNPDATEALLRQLRTARPAATDRDGLDGSDEDEDGEDDNDDEEKPMFNEALAATFTRPGGEHTIHDDVHLGTGAVANPARRAELIGAEIATAKAGEPPSAKRFREIPRRVWDRSDSSVRAFLLEQYHGHCQICDATFPKRDGSSYFEGLYLVSRTKAAWIDRPGNTLGLCATCCAKFQHGAVEADRVIDQVLSWQTSAEGGGPPTLRLTLCGEEVSVRFTERHLFDLRQMVLAGDSA